MSKAMAAQPASPLSRFWHKWRFHINILLVLIPLGFMPRYFHDVALFRGTSGLGERTVGEIPVGPWSITLAEFRAAPPELDGPAGYMKTFTGALCKECISQVKATYLRIGKPRSLRAAGGIFFGSGFDHRYQLKVFLKLLQRRHEQVQTPATRFCTQGGAGQPIRRLIDDRLWLIGIKRRFGM